METTVSRFKVQIYSACWSMLKCHCAHYAYAALDIRRKRCNALANIFQVLEGALKDLCKYWVCHRHLHRHRSHHLAHNFTQDANIYREVDWLGYGTLSSHGLWRLKLPADSCAVAVALGVIQFSVFGFLFFVCFAVASLRPQPQAAVNVTCKCAFPFPAANAHAT